MEDGLAGGEGVLPRGVEDGLTGGGEGVLPRGVEDGLNSHNDLFQIHTKIHM